MSRPFIAKHSGGRCPGCGLPLKATQPVQYQHPDWPWKSDWSAGHVLWHERCVNQALVAGLCPYCHLLHREHGTCLL